VCAQGSVAAPVHQPQECLFQLGLRQPHILRRDLCQHLFDLGVALQADLHNSTNDIYSVNHQGFFRYLLWHHNLGRNMGTFFL
jgi:hypothetical protein